MPESNMETDDPVVVEQNDRKANRILGFIIFASMFIIGVIIGTLIPHKSAAASALSRTAFEEGAVYGAQAIAQGATNYTQVILSAYRFKAQAKASVATMQQSQIEQARAQYKP